MNNPPPHRLPLPTTGHQTGLALAGHQGAPLRLAAGGHDLGSGEREDGGHAGEERGAGQATAGFNAANDRLDSDLGLSLGPVSAQLGKGLCWHAGLMTFLQPFAKPFYNLYADNGLCHKKVMGIGERVAEAMRRKGLQQEDVAAQLGVSQTIVSRIITGVMPGTKHHEALAKLLGVSREWIAAGDELGVAVACDYMGVVNLGIFTKPLPEVTTKAAERLASKPAPVVADPAPAPKPAIKVLGVIGEATPLDNPPSEAPPAPSADQRRLERRLESTQSGVDNIEGDLVEKRTTIISNLKALYGIVPDPRDVPPDRGRWQAPCAMIELEQAMRAPKTNTNAPQWNTRFQNAQAQVNNLNSYLKHDRSVEKDLVARLKKAERDRDAAKAALAEVRP